MSNREIIIYRPNGYTGLFKCQCTCPRILSAYKTVSIPSISTIDLSFEPTETLNKIIVSTKAISSLDSQEMFDEKPIQNQPELIEDSSKSGICDVVQINNNCVTNINYPYQVIKENPNTPITNTSRPESSKRPSSSFGKFIYINSLNFNFNLGNDIFDYCGNNKSDIVLSGQSLYKVKNYQRQNSLKDNNIMQNNEKVICGRQIKKISSERNNSFLNYSRTRSNIMTDKEKMTLSSTIKTDKLSNLTSEDDNLLLPQKPIPIMSSRVIISSSAITPVTSEIDSMSNIVSVTDPPTTNSINPLISSTKINPKLHINIVESEKSIIVPSATQNLVYSNSGSSSYPLIDLKYKFPMEKTNYRYLQNNKDFREMYKQFEYNSYQHIRFTKMINRNRSESAKTFDSFGNVKNRLHRLTLI